MSISVIIFPSLRSGFDSRRSLKFNSKKGQDLQFPAFIHSANSNILCTLFVPYLHLECTAALVLLDEVRS